MATASAPNLNPTTREEWLAKRRTGIGASDVGAILGFSKWRDHLEVWADKTGRAPARDSTLRMRLGTALEPFIADEFERVTALRVLDPGAHALYQHPDVPYFRCTPDRLLFGPDPIPVELKSVHPFQADEWEAPWAPLDYQAQLQFQIHILGAKRGYLAGLTDQELMVRPFDANKRFIDQMVAKLHEFWRFVETDTEPPADWNRAIALSGFKLLHPDDNGDTVQLGVEVLPAVQDYLDKTEMIKQLQKQADAQKARLIAAIGDATFAEIGPYRFSYKTQERAAYEVKPSKFRVLRQCKK